MDTAVQVPGKAIFRIWFNYILPNLKKDQVLLENVQRRATRLVKSVQGKSFSERLRSLVLPSLEYRRLRNDMVQTYKIVNKLFTVITDVRTIGHLYKLFKRKSRLNIRKIVFRNRVVDTRSSLPDSIDDLRHPP